MDLRTDIRTVLIVRELRGSSTAIGIRVVVSAAELAYMNISLWNTRCFIAGFGWIGLIFLFERDGIDVPMMGLGTTNLSPTIGYRAGSRSSSILETCHEHESKSSTVVTEIGTSQPVAISLKMGIQLKTLGILIFHSKILLPRLLPQW